MNELTLDEVRDDEFQPFEEAVQEFLSRKLIVSKNGDCRILPLSAMMRDYYSFLKDLMLLDVGSSEFFAALEGKMCRTIDSYVADGYDVKFLRS